MWSEMSVLLWTVYWLQSSPTQPLWVGEELHIPQTPFPSILPLLFATFSQSSFSWSFHLSLLYLIRTPLCINMILASPPLFFFFLHTEPFSSLVLLELAARFFSCVCLLPCSGASVPVFLYFCNASDQWHLLQSQLESKHSLASA